MTAEIAIVNLGAVALAADSAVTIQLGGRAKIFQSVNKLFSLSDVAPVGIMIFNRADFMNIPWETLVKEYRYRLGSNTFAKLQDYSDDFCSFLDNEVRAFLDEQYHELFAYELVESMFGEIENRIGHALYDPVFEDIPPDVRLDSLTETVVENYYQRALSAKFVEGAPDNFLKQVSNFLRSATLKKIRESIFDRKLKRGIVSRLNYIARRVLVAPFSKISERFDGPYAGIVIAGFGEKQLFPAVSEIQVEGLVLNVLKKNSIESTELGPEMGVTIGAFAQRDMAEQFMEGMAPAYIEYMYESVVSHLDGYTGQLLGQLGKYSEKEKEVLRGVLKNSYGDIANSFVREMSNIGKRQFADPILDVVRHLPKEQLAEMAEALVSLTSLKRTVSPGEETVGGPTDVALITKGDGFIWVKRKHYFDAELNPAYFARTYKKGEKYGTTPWEDQS